MPKKKKGNARQVIHHFFSENSLGHYRKYITSMLKAAYSEGYWKKSDPGRLLHFQQMMQELIEAVYEFVKEGKSGIKLDSKTVIQEAIIKGEGDISLFHAHYSEENIWALFPRNLSQKEFQNPFLVYRKFFRLQGYKSWVMDFGELVSLALSPFGNESALDYDYLEIHRLLQKMVEASHLIEIRTHKQDPEDGGEKHSIFSS